MNCHEAEPLLNPYFDGELDLPTALRMEEHIAGCPACSGEYANLRELHRQIADSALDFRPTPALERRVAGARKRAAGERPAWWRSPAFALAAASVFVALLVLPVRWRSGAPADADLFESHIRSLMADHLVDVPSSDHHTVKPWFQGKLDFSPDVPDLGPQGFTLVGGRLDLVDRAPAAAIVYKRRNHVINLFVAHAQASESPLRGRSSAGYQLFEWTRNGLHYSAISDLNAAELRQFAELAGAK